MDLNMHSQLSNEDNWLSKLPPGYKFYPNDVELIDYYLKQKLAGVLIIAPRIHDVDVYKYPPEELEKTYKFKGENDMYFFTPRSKKYKEGQRPDRDVEDNGFQYGFWKATGKEIPVMNKDAEIGLKRTLVYYKGKQGKPKQEKPNEPAVKTNSKTNWIMQEFRIKNLTSSSATLHNMDDLVLCKIYEHQYGMKKDQITDKNNKRPKVSTNVAVTPQCQPNQYHQTQCMQPSLSPNMVNNSQCHFNQNSDLAQKMQDDALFAHMIVRARYQPSQHSQSQCQFNQHSNQVQQISTSLSRNMFFAPQDQPYQHSQFQAMKVSSSPYRIGISQGQSNQHSDQVQQMPASLSRNMVVAPQDLPNQHYAQDQQMQSSLSSNMLAMPQQMQDYLLRSHSQMEDESDACDFINFDSCVNNHFEYFSI